MNSADRDTRRGYFAALGAFFIWGLLPLYIYQLVPTPPVQIMAHRVVWAAVFVMGFIVYKGQLRALRAVLSDTRALCWLMLSAVLISANWLVYVWAVSSGHVVESSLGYFINPLFSVLLGVLVLKERLRPAQWLAVGVAAIGVIWLAVRAGRPPWIALSLAFSFGSYGLIRKQVVVDSVIGLGIETLLIAPFMLVYLAWTMHNGSFAMGQHGVWVDSLLVLSGAFTAVPLVLFAFGVRRIPLSTLGLLQYLGPTLQLLTGIFLFHEPFDQTRMIGFAMIWGALAIYVAEGFWRSAQRRSLNRKLA